MARQPMVTRTIQTTHATVLCMDIQNGEPCNRTIVLPRTYKDDETVLKAVKKVIDSDTIKAVHVVHTEVQETLYGMSEQDFISHATVLPPRKDYTSGEDGSTTNEISKLLKSKHANKVYVLTIAHAGFEQRF